MSKFKKTKEWMKEHSEELLTAGIIVGGIAASIILVVAAQKAYNEQVKAQAQLMDDLAAAYNRGARVLPSPTGFWFIEPEAA